MKKGYNYQKNRIFNNHFEYFVCNHLTYIGICVLFSNERHVWFFFDLLFFIQYKLILLPNLS